MLATPGANILPLHNRTTAIAQHFSFSCYFLSLLFISVFYHRYLELQLKKIGAKIFGFGIGFANAKIMPKKFFYFGTRFADLPFWQFGRGACHFGSIAAILTG
jgi:hypothetical protein